MKISPKYKIGCGLLILLTVASIFFTYRMCLHTTQRVFTRENTLLEKLPEGEPIPMMPDGKRVDYVRAYALIYPDYLAARDDNALRDVVRFMGKGIYLWTEDFASEADTPEMQAAWKTYCEKLGLQPAELASYAGVTNAEAPNKIIAQRICRQAADDPNFQLPPDLLIALAESSDRESAFENYYWQRFSHPWTAAEFPEMAQWLESHAEMLDTIAAAARQDVFLFPFYRYDENETLLTTFSFDAIFLLQISRITRWRGYMRLAEGDAAGAIADLETAWRLACHISHQPHTYFTVAEGLWGQPLARELLVELLAANICTPEQLESLAALLDALPPPPALEDILTVDNWCAQEYVDLIPEHGIGPNLTGITAPPMAGIDPNYLADRYGALQKQRMAHIAAGEYDELKRLYCELSMRNLDRRTLKLPMLSVRVRSEMYAEVVFELFSMNSDEMLYTLPRTEQNRQLARLAVALKRHKADHGAYPDTLDALVPAYLPTLPDLPEYSREDAGFVLTATAEGFEPVVIRMAD